MVNPAQAFHDFLPSLSFAFSVVSRNTIVVLFPRFLLSFKYRSVHILCVYMKHICYNIHLKRETLRSLVELLLYW